MSAMRTTTPIAFLVMLKNIGDLLRGGFSDILIEPLGNIHRDVSDMASYPAEAAG